MNELSAGNRQVLAGLQEIESGIAQIRDGSAEMNEGAGVILNEIARLFSVSEQVRDRSGSIAASAEAISDAVSKIVENSGKNKAAADVLVGITGRFRL